MADDRRSHSIEQIHYICHFNRKKGLIGFEAQGTGHKAPNVLCLRATVATCRSRGRGNVSAAPHRLGMIEQGSTHAAARGNRAVVSVRTMMD
jgi:hypothetical protein